MTAHTDHYRVLNIDSNADETAIKKAYRRIALANHPDKTLHLPTPERERKTQKFLQATVSYEILLENKTWEAYDSGYSKRSAPEHSSPHKLPKKRHSRRKEERPQDKKTASKPFSARRRASRSRSPSPSPGPATQRSRPFRDEARPAAGFGSGTASPTPKPTGSHRDGTFAPFWACFADPAFPRTPPAAQKPNRPPTPPNPFFMGRAVPSSNPPTNSSGYTPLFTGRLAPSWKPANPADLMKPFFTGHTFPPRNPVISHAKTAAPNTLQLNAHTRAAELAGSFSFAPTLLDKCYATPGWSITITLSNQYLLTVVPNVPAPPQITQEPVTNDIKITFCLAKNIDRNGVPAPAFTNGVQITIAKTPYGEPCFVSSLFVEKDSMVDLHITIAVRQTLVPPSPLCAGTTQPTLEWAFDVDKGHLAHFAFAGRQLRATHIMFYPKWRDEFLPGGVVPDEPPFPEATPGAHLAAVYPGMRFVKLLRGIYCEEVDGVGGKLWRLLAVGTVDL